jgi:hypothetical protein
VEVGPRLYRSSGSETIAFVADTAGRLRAAVTVFPFQGIQTWLRVGWLETARPTLMVVALAVLVSIVALVRPPRARPAAAASPRPSIEGAGPVIARLAAAVVLLYLVLMVLGARAAAPTGLQFAVPWQMDAAGIIAVCVVGALIPLGWLAVSAWRGGTWTLAGRVYVSALTVAIALFGVSLWYWNLLGIHH